MHACLAFVQLGRPPSSLGYEKAQATDVRNMDASGGRLARSDMTAEDEACISVEHARTFLGRVGVRLCPIAQHLFGQFDRSEAV